MTYSGWIRPYGLIATSLMKAWSDMIGAMDRNDAVFGTTVRPVDEDKDGSLLKQAVAEHVRYPNVFQTLASAEYRDDDLAGGVTWAKMGSIEYQAEIEPSKVPMLIFVS